MVVLPAGVPLEECAGMLEQFRRDGEVCLRVRQVGVPKVNREVIDEPLHICSLAVPRCQAVDREGVAKVMQAGLVAAAIGAPNAGKFPQPLEGTVQGASVHGFPSSVKEEGSTSAGRRM